MKRKHLALLVLLLVTGLACLLPERVLADYDLKRMQVTAEVNADGLIAFDGTSPVDVKQIPMGLEPDNAIKFTRQQAQQ